MGIATIIWLATSGGVIIAAMISTTITACFLYLRIKSGVMIPNRVKKYTIIGSSNTIPHDNTDDLTTDI